MGLDARVYLNPKHLPADLLALSPVAHPESGEFTFGDDETTDRNHARTLAIRRRIGNIAFVAEIRHEVTLAFGHGNSLVSTKVVYSGSHAGDWIAYPEIGRLADEIEFLERKTRGRRSESLDEFISKMRELIAAAQREENAIVF
jgi:hypothetical protein